MSRPPLVTALRAQFQHDTEALTRGDCDEQERAFTAAFASVPYPVANTGRRGWAGTHSIFGAYRLRPFLVKQLIRDIADYIRNDARREGEPLPPIEDYLPAAHSIVEAYAYHRHPESASPPAQKPGVAADKRG